MMVKTIKKNRGVTVKSMVLGLIGFVLAAIVALLVNAYVVRFLPVSNPDAGINLYVRDPGASCDSYAFHVIFKASDVDKVHFSIQTPNPILAYRLAYSQLVEKTPQATLQEVGKFGEVIHRAGGCEFITPQEQLPANVTVSAPFPNLLVVDASDVQNPIVGEILLLRALDVQPKDFSAEGAYAFQEFGLSLRRDFEFALDLDHASRLN
jgi:hypothetical protein